MNDKPAVRRQRTHRTLKLGVAVAANAPQTELPVAGNGKCTVSGCSCPSYVDPPGGFSCKRCGHNYSDHW